MPESGAIKFFESIDMDKLYKKDGKIEGFYDVPISITGKLKILMQTLIQEADSLTLFC